MKGEERRGGMKLRFPAVVELQMLMMGQKVLPCSVLEMYVLNGRQ